MDRVKSSEAADLIYRDLVDKEYAPAADDKREFLAKSAAKRIVRLLEENGYNITKGPSA